MSNSTNEVVFEPRSECECDRLLSIEVCLDFTTLGLISVGCINVVVSIKPG